MRNVAAAAAPIMSQPDLKNIDPFQEKAENHYNKKLAKANTKQDRVEDITTKGKEVRSNFVKVLTSMLTNQDPSKPFEMTDLIQPFTLLAKAEGDMMQLEMMATMMETNLSGQVITAAGHVGDEAEVEAQIFSHSSDNPSRINYKLPTGAAKTMVTISELIPGSDPNSEDLYDYRAVATFDVDSAAGKHEFVWNGLDKEGKFCAEGKYMVEVHAKQEMTNNFGEVVKDENGNTLYVDLVDPRTNRAAEVKTTIKTRIEGALNHNNQAAFDMGNDVIIPMKHLVGISTRGSVVTNGDKGAKDDKVLEILKDVKSALPQPKIHEIPQHLKQYENLQSLI